MAKNSIRDFSATAGSNTDIQSVNIDENCPASGINNAIRELMVDLKNVSTGAVNLETPAADSLTVAGDLTVDTNTLKVALALLIVRCILNRTLVASLKHLAQPSKFITQMLVVAARSVCITVQKQPVAQSITILTVVCLPCRETLVLELLSIQAATQKLCVLNQPMVDCL